MLIVVRHGYVRKLFIQVLDMVISCPISSVVVAGLELGLKIPHGVGNDSCSGHGSDMIG